LTPGFNSSPRACFQRLKLIYDKLLSNFAFKCNLRRYTKGFGFSSFVGCSTTAEVERARDAGGSLSIHTAEGLWAGERNMSPARNMIWVVFLKPVVELPKPSEEILQARRNAWWGGAG